MKLDISANHCAAKEKIASDLACELGLPVPPVLLYRPDSGGLACLSLVCHPKQYEVRDLFPKPCAAEAVGQELLEFLATLIEPGIMALDALLQNQDRENPRNTILGYGDLGEAPEFLFIDFGRAMNWPELDFTRFDRIRLPTALKPLLKGKREAVIRAARKISELPDDLIHSIVDRVPGDFLNPGVRDLLYQGLIARKSMLVGTISTWYPGREVRQ